MLLNLIKFNHKWEYSNRFMTIIKCHKVLIISSSNKYLINRHHNNHLDFLRLSSTGDMEAMKFKSWAPLISGSNIFLCRKCLMGRFRWSRNSRLVSISINSQLMANGLVRMIKTKCATNMEMKIINCSYSKIRYYLSKSLLR